MKKRLSLLILLPLFIFGCNSKNTDESVNSLGSGNLSNEASEDTLVNSEIIESTPVSEEESTSSEEKTSVSDEESTSEEEPSAEESQIKTSAQMPWL